MSTLLGSGDELILSDPHYACHPNFVSYLGAVPRTIPVFEDDGFQYRLDDIRAALTARTRAILINSPANPTGTLLSPERMAEIAQVAATAPSRPWIFSDEIYHGLVYQGRARSILEFTDHCLVFNGFSKLFAMTGWRLGYVIVPRDLVRPMQTMLQNFFISASSLAQAAAYAALTDPTVRAALRIDGVHAVLTAEDFAGYPDLPPGLPDFDRPVVARNRVRFVGEPVEVDRTLLDLLAAKIV